MSLPDLNAWYAGIAGQTIDVDGAMPGECHDVGLSWMYYLGVTPGDGHAPGTEYTDEVWKQFPNHRPGLAQHFTKHDASEIRRGDLVYWYAYAGVGGLPHVAVATGPAANGVVRCVTQNPREVHIENLTLDGVLGVLRPLALDPNGDNEMTPDQDKKLDEIHAALWRMTKPEGMIEKLPARTAKATLNYPIKLHGTKDTMSSLLRHVGKTETLLRRVLALLRRKPSAPK